LGKHALVIFIIQSIGYLIASHLCYTNLQTSPTKNKNIDQTLPAEILNSFQIEEKPDEPEQEAENEEEVKYKPLVDVVDNPIFRFENTKQNNDKNPFLPEQVIFINVIGLLTVYQPTYGSVS
jgi:hypothetical protein